jgi:hypothetical protein
VLEGTAPLRGYAFAFLAVFGSERRGIADVLKAVEVLRPAGWDLVNVTELRTPGQAGVYAILRRVPGDGRTAPPAREDDGPYHPVQPS